MPEISKNHFNETIENDDKLTEKEVKLLRSMTVFDRNTRYNKEMTQELKESIKTAESEERKLLESVVTEYLSDKPTTGNYWMYETYLNIMKESWVNLSEIFKIENGIKKVKVWKDRFEAPDIPDWRFWINLDDCFQLYWNSNLWWGHFDLKDKWTTNDFEQLFSGNKYNYKMWRVENFDLINTSVSIIPEEFWNRFDGLKSINILWNEKLTSIPESIANLKDLEEISIVGNPLITYLPDSFCNLEKIKNLEILDCWLNSLPNEIWELLTLKTLDISWNPISKLPESIYKLDLINLKINGTTLNVEEIKQEFENNGNTSIKIVKRF